MTLKGVLRMTCEKCNNLIDKMNLRQDHVQTTAPGKLKNAMHSDLLVYADYNNGVSEGGNGFICVTCKSFFTLLYHISSNEPLITWEREITEEEIVSAAHMMVLKKEAEKVRSELSNKKTHDVYYISGLHVPYSFRDGTLLKPLEIHYQYGINHGMYSDYPHIYLDFEGIIKDLSRNDDYVKTMFFLTFELKSADIEVSCSPSPYTEPEINFSTKAIIKPNDIFLLNPLTREKKPLLSTSLAEYNARDNDSYLLNIRKVEALLKKNSTISKSSIEDKIASVANEIRSSL
jgi:hypothetical protein